MPNFKVLTGMIFLYLLSINLFGQPFQFSLSNSDINQWYQYPANGWSFSVSPDDSTITLLAHAFDSDATSYNYISANRGNLTPGLRNFEWNCRIKHGYAPSSSNKWSVILAGNENLFFTPDDPLAHGLLAGVNFKGYDDTLRIWSIENGMNSVVATTNINWQTMVGAADFYSLKIKIDSLGKITILGGADSLSLVEIGNGNYQSQSSFNQTGFGYWYTAAQDQKFWIENYSISGSIYNDTVAPKIETYLLINDSSIVIKYTEPIAKLLLSQFQPDGPYNVINIDSLSTQDYLIYFAPKIKPGQEISFFNSGISDPSGNILKDTILNLYSPDYQSIIINEILADPSPVEDLPEYEFIELFNSSPHAINLQNWTISNGKSTVLLPEYEFESQSFLILTHPDANELYKNFGATLPVVSSKTFLLNSGSSVILNSFTQDVIDSIAYISSMSDPSKQDGGWSLERTNPTKKCTGSALWQSSTNLMGGTPGNVNSVLDTIFDLTPIHFSTTEIIDPSSVRMWGSENIPQNLDDLIKHFQLQGISGLESASDLELESDTTLILKFSTPFENGEKYHLMVINLPDQCQNLTNQDLEFEFRLPEPFDLLITEILAAPNSNQFESVELYNHSSYQLDLKTITMHIGSKSFHFPSLIILPGSYISVIGSSTEKPDNSFVNVLESGFSLNNTSQIVYVTSNQGKYVHHVNYNSEWHTDNQKSEGGWSLEMIDINNPCGSSENWGSTQNSNGHTLSYTNSLNGYHPDTLNPEIKTIVPINDSLIFIRFTEPIHPNIIDQISLTLDDDSLINPIWQQPEFTSLTIYSQYQLGEGYNYTLSMGSELFDCAENRLNPESEYPIQLPGKADSGDVVINELLFNPSEENAEFIEFFNSSDKSINVKNLKIGYGSDEFSLEFYTISDDYLLLPQNYLVLSKNPELVLNYFNRTHQCNYLKMDPFPMFKNDAGYMVIVDSEEQEIDRIYYSEDFHHPLLFDVQNVSLERITAKYPALDSQNWHSASISSGYGTPGDNNSQITTFVPTEREGKITLSTQIISPNNDGVNDILEIGLSEEFANSMVSLKILNSSGYIVRNLGKNLLSGGQTILYWDGTNDNRSLVTPGMYIIVLENFSLTGRKAIIRKVIVVS